MLAVAEHANIQSELIPRIATGFCGGLSRTGGMCGAVSGAVMVIGLFMGRNSPSDPKDPCYQTVQAFIRNFTDQFGALSCSTLTGVNLGTPAGLAVFKTLGLNEKCANYVAMAARLVFELTNPENR